MTTTLEQIRNDLDKYIKSELEKSQIDRDWEVFSFENDLYEIIEAMEEIIYYDPTPNGDSPYSDAEYIITAEERHRKAFEQKLIDKG